MPRGGHHPVPHWSVAPLAPAIYAHGRSEGKADVRHRQSRNASVTLATSLGRRERRAEGHTPFSPTRGRVEKTVGEILALHQKEG